MVGMAKRKKVSGQHQSPRKPVQLPADWLQVAKGLAQDRPMPVNWLLVELIKREAEAKGKTDLPPLPWSAPK
jgi:hypothetical protein